jgi:putative tricarboxylic transport membrane protein
MVISTLGAYSVNRSLFDVGLLYVIGAAGYAMRRASIPLAPAIIALILGPMAEQQYRRALAIAEGSAWVFVTRPISATLLGIALALLVVPLVFRGWMGRRASAKQ